MVIPLHRMKTKDKKRSERKGSEALSGGIASTVRAQVSWELGDQQRLQTPQISIASKYHKILSHHLYMKDPQVFAVKCAGPREHKSIASIFSAKGEIKGYYKWQL